MPSRRRCWTSRTASRPTPATSPHRSGCRLAIELERVPVADGATIEDLSFGEDYELLAATPDPLGFPVIGRCEEGEGVAVTRDGVPVTLSGWDHFR